MRTPILPYLLTQARFAEYDIDKDDPPQFGRWHGLVVAYVWNTPEGFSFVTSSDCDRLRVSEPQLRDMAVNDLGRHASGTLRFEPRGPVVGAFMGGDFEASFVLVDRLWDEMLADRFPSGYAVTIPANDMLAICGIQSADGVAELRAISQRTFGNGEDLLLPGVFSRIGGVWTQMT